MTALDGPGLAYQVAFRIPVGTVLWEEIAFRGVLQAALRRVMPEPAAIAVASGVFGVWHIRPTAAALRINGLAGDRRHGHGPRGRRRRGDRRGRRAVRPGCGPARAAWPRPWRCTWPPTASARWWPGRSPATPGELAAPTARTVTHGLPSPC